MTAETRQVKPLQISEPGIALYRNGNNRKNTDKKNPREIRRHSLINLIRPSLRRRKRLRGGGCGNVFKVDRRRFWRTGYSQLPCRRCCRDGYGCRWRMIILPAVIGGRPILTPRRLDLLSRPFLVEPTPFLWAKNCKLSLSILNLCFIIMTG